MKISHLFRVKNIVFIVCFLTMGLFYPKYGFSIQPSHLHFLQTYHENLGDLFYASRDIPGHLERSLAAYKKAIKSPKNSDHIYWKISRSYWILGQRDSVPSMKLDYLKKAYQAGKNAIRKNPKNPKSHLWSALSLGSLAVESGVMKKISTKDEIKKSLQKSLQLNTNEVEALLGLASWYFHVPEFFGGSRKQAYRLIEKAIQIDPNFTASHKLKANFFIQEERYSDARFALLQLLRIEDPTSRPGGVEDKALAKEMLKFISVKFS